VEADDFDPPQLESAKWDPATAHLRVQVRDPSGVAYVRWSHHHLGLSYVQDLALMDGDARSGEWRLPFPSGAEVRNGRLAVADELYNMEEFAVSW
jgi:hypothetical protein